MILRLSQQKSFDNEEIRKAATHFESFDADSIAQRVVEEQELNTSVLSHRQSSNLTLSDKQSMVKIEAAQMGIELSEAEVFQVVESNQNEFSDSVEFLISIRELIREFLFSRNQERKIQRESLTGSIAEVIDAANQEDARNALEANQYLKNIVDQCKRQSATYNNPYSSRLESIREGLRARQAKVSS
ncbi:hypothetical protein [Nostoc sp.]